MKKIFCLFTGVLLTFISVAQAQAVNENTAATLQAAANKSRKVQPKIPQKEQLSGPLAKLLERQNPENWEEISWKEFQKQNKRAKEVELCSMNIDVECSRQAAQLSNGEFFRFMKRGQGKADYASVVAGQKIIYIGEMHNTQNTIPEVVTILQTVRDANPKARILLATEFLVWSPNILSTQMPSLMSSYLEYSRLLASGTLSPKAKEEVQKDLENINDLLRKDRTKINTLALLKKADKPTELLFSADYAPVLETADRLKIDQLALEDFVFSMEAPYVAKVGGTLVRAEKKDRIPSYDNNSETSFFELLAISPWGVRERNREWARRIKAVESLYDVIVVYGGMGHFTDTYSFDLPPLVGIKDYASISLLSYVPQSEEELQLYIQRDYVADKNGFQQTDKVEQVEDQLGDFIPKDIWEEWTDYSQPFWFYGDEGIEQKIREYTKTVSGDQATQDFIKRYQETYPVTEKRSLTVVLPLE